MRLLRLANTTAAKRIAAMCQFLIIGLAVQIAGINIVVVVHSTTFPPTTLALDVREADAS